YTSAGSFHPPASLLPSSPPNEGVVVIQDHPDNKKLRTFRYAERRFSSSGERLGEQLGDVPDLDGAVPLEEAAPDLEETAGAVDRHDLRPCPLDGREFAREPLAGHIGIVHRKVTAKAAALADLVELPEFIPREHPQEAPLGLSEPQAPEATTRIVGGQRDLVRSGLSGRPLPTTQDPHQ